MLSYRNPPWYRRVGWLRACTTAVLIGLTIIFVGLVIACGSPAAEETPVVPSSSSSTAPKKTPPKTPAAKTPAKDPRFATCKEAIAAGYGPYVKDQDPEYAWYRDGDSDGIACERN